MPGRSLAGARFLDQDMFMEDAHAPGARQPRGNGGGGRVAHEVLVFRDAPPVAIIVEESPGIAGRHAVAGKGARLGLVASHAGGDDIDPGREDAAQTDNAVTLVGFDFAIRRSLHSGRAAPWNRGSGTP